MLVLRAGHRLNRCLLRRGEGGGPLVEVVGHDGVGEVHKRPFERYLIGLRSGCDTAVEIGQEVGDGVGTDVGDFAVGELMEAEHGSHGWAAGVGLAVELDLELFGHGGIN